MNVDYDGQTAFDAAANGDFPLPVDLLAAKGQSGNTLVHYAAASGEDTCDTMHFLMQQMNASGREQLLMDAKNDAGETPLIHTVTLGIRRSTGSGRTGNTAAHHAAAQGHLWMLHFLLEAEQRRNAALAKEGKPVESTMLGGYSLQHRNVLHYACMSEYKPMVQYLLTRGFDANEADAEGNTCMDLAKRRNLLWLEDLLSGKAKAADPPTHMRKTRGILLLVWWLALPLIFIILGKSLAAFRQPGHGHGHSHGAAPKNLANMHPSKRNVKVAMNVSLERIEKSKKVKDETSVGLHTLIRPQPESAMGIWMGWVSLFTMLYIVLWDFRDSHTVFLGITGGAEVVFLAVWARLAFLHPTDPGTITTYEQDFCRTCLVMKPIRSKHCAQCGICIARHDHHCAWINRCVGYGNHRSFFAFLLLHCIVLGIYAALSVLVLSDATHDLHAERVKSDGSGSSDSLSAMDVWIEIPSLIKKHLLVIMVLVWDLMAFVALAMMVNQHVTTLTEPHDQEQMNWRRYAYMSQKPASGSKDGKSGKKATPGAMFNPFDRGFKMNSAVDYRKVFTVPSSGASVNSSATNTTVEMSATSEDIEDKNNAGDVV
ncbi:Ankyrin repeat-containing domain [Phytophthora cactorum]|nr:Ankyrin repeat-containing domain [Phytophthora cactorum]